MEWYWIVLIVVGGVVVFAISSILLYRQFFKRFFDIVLSLFAIIILSPLIVLMIIIGAFVMRGNPFFLQPRPGKNGKLFKLIKFRSMDNRKDENGKLLPDSIRLSKYGKFIRKTSLDELPELFNIFNGSMSIVGPRPLMARYLSFYTNEEKHRHDVRPGLTGYAQIHGRNEVDWGERLKLDLIYVNNLSLWTDIKIIFGTVKIVLKSEGTSNENMENFDDYCKRTGRV